MSKLRPYQKEGVKQIIKFKGRVLLADEMRLGKTIQTLWYLKIRPKIRPALVICPSGAKWVWEEQAHEHIGMDSIILSGRKPIKATRSTIADWPELTIINYEIVHYWKNFLKKMNYQIVLIDESHQIKNKGAQRTRACIFIARKVPHIIAISGTPIVNKPIEIFSILNLIDKNRWGKRWDFAWTYCKPKHNGWGWDLSGHSNTKKLNKILRKTCMIRRRRKDVYSQLPDKIRMVVPLDMRNPKEYRYAESDFAGWLGNKSPTRLKRALQAESLTKLGYLKRLATRLKIKAVKAWVDNFLEESDEKLVLLGLQKPAIQYLCKKYDKIAVNGRVSPVKRWKAVKEFQTNKHKRLYIGNIIASGTAIELKPANTMAFFELDWVPGNHTQAEDRIVHVHDKEPPSIYYLVAKGTIEQDLCKILQRKSRVVSSVLDGDKNMEDMNIFDKLMTAVQERNSS